MQTSFDKLTFHHSIKHVDKPTAVRKHKAYSQLTNTPNVLVLTYGDCWTRFECRLAWPLIPLPNHSKSNKNIHGKDFPDAISLRRRLSVSRVIPR